MKNKILFLLAALALATCGHIDAQVTDRSQFIDGSVTVKGKITDTATSDPVIGVVPSTYNACLGSRDDYEVAVDSKGRFSVTVPACHPQIGTLATPWGNMLIGSL